MIIRYTAQAADRAWYNSPAIVAALGVSAIALGIFIYPEFASQPIVHYRADDNSLSYSLIYLLYIFFQPLISFVYGLVIWGVDRKSYIQIA